MIQPNNPQLNRAPRPFDKINNACERKVSPINGFNTLAEKSYPGNFHGSSADFAGFQQHKREVEFSLKVRHWMQKSGLRKKIKKKKKTVDILMFLLSDTSQSVKMATAFILFNHLSPWREEEIPKNARSLKILARACWLFLVAKNFLAEGSGFALDSSKCFRITFINTHYAQTSGQFTIQLGRAGTCFSFFCSAWPHAKVHRSTLN